MYMKNKNFFWGIVFILAAVFTLFGSLGYFSHVNTTKLLLTFLFLYIIVKNIPTRNFYGILIPAAFILIMYDHYLFFAGFSRFSILAAAILGSIGLSFLFPSQPRIAFDGQNEFQRDNSSGGSCNESVVTCSVSFAASTKYVETEDFQRAYLKCLFGTLKVYFDRAKINGSSAEIFVTNSFGDTSLFLPKEWNVSVTATNTFADIEEVHKMPVAMQDAPVVTIRGNISFGDCKIFYI